MVEAERAASLPSDGKPLDGSFSIIDWSGYPASLPRPPGPFRLLEGAEYAAARRAANQANKVIHQTTPGIGGLHIHEVHPVKWGWESG